MSLLACHFALSQSPTCLAFAALSPSPRPACPSPPLTLPNPCAPASRQLITEPAPDELSFVVKFLIIALGLQVFLRCPPLLSLTPLSSFFFFLSLLEPPPLDTAEINIFSQSMEATEGLKMQRQSFDFQLTELPISPALISHALPFRPAVLSVEALTLSLSTTGQVYHLLSGILRPAPLYWPY